MSLQALQPSTDFSRVPADLSAHAMGGHCTTSMRVRARVHLQQPQPQCSTGIVKGALLQTMALLHQCMQDLFDCSGCSPSCSVVWAAPTHCLSKKQATQAKVVPTAAAAAQHRPGPRQTRLMGAGRHSHPAH